MSGLLAICIGCGCDDERACVSEANSTPCEWLRVDYGMGLGVCSGCPEHEARWDAGDYSMSAAARDDWDDGDGSGLILPGDDAFDETLEGIY